MAIELYNKDGHVCLMFTHLGDEDGEAVQANQFLVVDQQSPTAHREAETAKAHRG